MMNRIHDRFLEKLLAFVRSAKLGDPALPDTQIGRIATRPQFEKILDYLADTRTRVSVANPASKRSRNF